MKESEDGTENDEVIYVIAHKQPLLVEAGHDPILTCLISPGG